MLEKCLDVFNFWLIGIGIGLVFYVVMLWIEKLWERFECIVVVYGVC